jgi:hypothetical protein
MAREETDQVAFRLPRSLVKKLDARVEQMQKANRGMEVTRTDVVRIILTQALEGAPAVEESRRRAR